LTYNLLIMIKKNSRRAFRGTPLARSTIRRVNCMAV
jgi:hypothetical protein